MNLDLLKRVEAQLLRRAIKTIHVKAHWRRRPGQQGELARGLLGALVRRTPEGRARSVGGGKSDGMIWPAFNATLLCSGPGRPRASLGHVHERLVRPRRPSPVQTRSGWRKWNGAGNRKPFGTMRRRVLGRAVGSWSHAAAPPRPTRPPGPYVLELARGRLTVGPLHVGVHLADLVRDDAVRCIADVLFLPVIPCTNS
jgi:hypothetical protein